MRAHPHPVDVHVGARLRQCRTLQGLSLADLSRCLGMSYQRLQKYERAQSRITVSTLHAIARALGVPLDFFFDGLAPTGRPCGESDDVTRQSLTLFRHFHVLPDWLRRQLCELVVFLAKRQTGGP